jgi:hypothetical protein
MGHDIYAFIKKENIGKKKLKSVSYFRISAFDTERRKIFYGTLKGSENADGGVSGTGCTLTFNYDDILNAKKMCEYFLEDFDLLEEFVLSKVNEKADISVQKFDDAITSLFGAMMKEEGIDDKKDNEEKLFQIKSNLVDTIIFHNQILEAYKKNSKKQKSVIEIDFL